MAVQDILTVEHEGLLVSVTVLPLDIWEKANRFGSEKKVTISLQ